MDIGMMAAGSIPPGKVRRKFAAAKKNSQSADFFHLRNKFFIADHYSLIATPQFKVAKAYTLRLI